MTAIQNLCTRAIWLENGTLHSEGDVMGQVSSYLKVGLRCAKITSDVPVSIGPDVQLTHMEFSPNLVESKSEANFVVELCSRRAVKISALAILVYSALGERVAIFDLRQAERVLALDGKTPLTLKGRVIALPLVEGVYSIGLYIDYGVFCGNLLELIELAVIEPPTKFGFTPHPPNSRGLVELDFHVW